MTKEEIIELKNSIDKHYDILEDRFVYTKLVTTSLETLLKHGMTQKNIELFCSTMGEFLDEVKKIIKEIDSSN